ncbi:MAG TPA: aldo/keto reductase [Chitinophagaceae bacterium]|nr:aldo/keto reductase [Chitinophagaceae bacterium]
MQYQLLGKSELRASVIGFGCMSLKPGQPESSTLLHRAIELGINFFDTADLYDKGANEEMLGAALKAKRKTILLASKVGNQWRADGSGWDWNARKEYILSSIDKSLQRLQTDYIDLYQMHGGMITDNIDEAIEAFESLKQQGKIRAYGISSIRPNVIREYIKRSSIDTVMMQYSLLDRRPEEECLGLLKEHNITVLSRGALAQGLLIDKPAKDYLGHSASEVKKVAEKVHELSNAVRSAAQTALGFVLQQVPVAIAGIRTMEQLEELAATINKPRLTEREMQELKNSAPALTYQDHR